MDHKAIVAEARAELRAVAKLRALLGKATVMIENIKATSNEWWPDRGVHTDDLMDNVRIAETHASRLESQLHYVLGGGKKLEKAA